MLTINYFSYSITIGIITCSMLINYQVLARNHHGKSPPPPVSVHKDHHLNPQQTPQDISPFAQQAAQVARQQQSSLEQQKTNKQNDNAPAALLPGHYTKRSTKVNGGQGWVNSKRRRGKYDLGINMPVPQTGDPTQNKTKGVFRRAMPVYEPNY